MLSSLARSPSQFQNRLVQTAVDPFTDRIVCRVTKISPARVASGLQSTNKPVSSLSPLERFCTDHIVYIDQSKSTGNVFNAEKTHNKYRFGNTSRLLQFFAVFCNWNNTSLHWRLWNNLQKMPSVPNFRLNVSNQSNSRFHGEV